MKAIILSNNNSALYPLLGKCVIQYVIEAVISAGIAVNDITVVSGDQKLAERYPSLQFDETYEEDGNLILWGDTPLITGEMITEFIANNELNLTVMPAISHGQVIFSRIETQVCLAEAVSHMQTRINTELMLAGVRMINPQSIVIDSTVEFTDPCGVVIYPGVILEGNTKIDGNVYLGANSHLKNAVVGEGAKIQQSVIFDSSVGAGTTVGPFAYLRQEAVIGENCRIGNFVEVKKSHIGDGTKAAHLAYIGDATVGKNVNYSCGAITANYDGKNKHRTTICDHAFIGCNSNLVAPVTIGEGAIVAAGSTIDKNLQAASLGIARVRQEEKLGWANKKK